jgi:hypothetical protein
MNVKTILTGSTLRAMLRPANTAALARASRRAVMPSRRQPAALEANLDGAYRWLCAAQDASGDGGVAGCYNLVKGWGGSYPETTGYAIPTILRYAAARQVPEAFARARRMADWEVDVQLPDGAVRSGMMGLKTAPAVFNTGQVLFGWVAAFQATNDDRYARAAVRAADWLISVQDADGAWRRHLSLLATSSVQAYNTRSAWGLAIAGHAVGEPRFLDAARKNCDWALTQQTANGWFRSNGFTDAEDPLLHTIGYILEGMLGVGELCRREDYVQAVIKGTDPMIEIYRSRGVLKGRYDRQWRAAVSWRCPTGEAQMAIVMLRLARITGEQRYAEVALSLIQGVGRLQDLDSPYPESYGGIPGSEPLWGGYMPFNYLNWAAKFFMDALLLHAEFRHPIQPTSR